MASLPSFVSMWPGNINLYKLIKSPNLIPALTGHVEGIRAFSRYRAIDIDMKKDLVKILEGKQ